MAEQDDEFEARWEAMVQRVQKAWDHLKVVDKDDRSLAILDYDEAVSEYEKVAKQIRPI